MPRAFMRYVRSDEASPKHPAQQLERGASMDQIVAGISYSRCRGGTAGGLGMAIADPKDGCAEEVEAAAGFSA